MFGYLRHRVPNTAVTAVLLLAITALAFLLRLPFLGQDSFWGDEILSVMRAELDSEGFWNLVLGRGGLPAMTLYYTILRFWVLLGDSEFMVRLLSVIFAVATVPLFFALGKRLFNTQIGLIAALLLAVNVFHIEYSQEARSYTLLIFLITASSLFLARSVQRSSWLNWAGYVATSALAVYSHWFAVLAIAAQVGSLVFLPRREWPWKGLIISGIVLSFALMPIGVSVSGEFSSLIFSPDGLEADETIFTHSAVTDTTWHRAYDFAVDLAGKGGVLLLLIYLFPLLVSSVTAVRTWMSTRASFESWKYALLLAWLFFPIAITAGYSVLVEPAFVARYLIFCLPALVLLAAAGIYQLYQLYQIDPVRVPIVSTVLLLVIVGLSFNAASAYYTSHEKEDWRGLTGLVASQWQPGDEILYYVPWTEDLFRFYFERMSGETLPGTSTLVPYRQWDTLTSATDGAEHKRETIVESLPDGPSRVWLVQSRVFTPGRLETSDVILEALACKYHPVEVKRYTDFAKVDVFLFQRQKVSDVAEQRVEAGCQESVIIKSLDLNIVEDFDNASDVGAHWGNGAILKISPAPGVKNQGYLVQFSGGGWWDVMRSAPSIDHNLYQGISLAIKGSGDITLQLREKKSPDGRGGEHWSVPIALTEEWRTLSYTWSDFQRTDRSPVGNGVLDLDLLHNVRLKQGSSPAGFVATDEWEWMFEPGEGEEEPEEQRVNATASAQ